MVGAERGMMFWFLRDEMLPRLSGGVQSEDCGWVVV